MEWLADNPGVVLVGLVAAVITIASTAWWCVNRMPVVKRLFGYLADRYLGSDREKREIDCRLCEGTGKYVASIWYNAPVREKCRICKGRGTIVTDRFDQPDCRYCEGTARVVVKNDLDRTYHGPCDVCDGIGKQPFD